MAWIDSFISKARTAKAVSSSIWFLSSDTVSLQSISWAFLMRKKFVHVTTRRKFVSVCNLFLGTCLHNACMTVLHVHDMFTLIHKTTAPLRGSRLACIPQQKGVACRRADHKCSSVDPGLPQCGDCYLRGAGNIAPIYPYPLKGASEGCIIYVHNYVFVCVYIYICMYVCIYIYINVHVVNKK